MSRIFSPDDRELLYVQAGGKCQHCGIALGPDFHADHVVPWSKGGTTTIDNGQALCPPCNLKKGNTMSVPFASKDYAAIANRDWQLEGIDRIARRVSTNDSTHLCIGCPGSGKTRFAVAVARAMKDAGIIDYVIVVSPKNTIRSNWHKTFSALANMTVQPVTSHKMRQQHISSLLTYDGISTTYQSTTRGYAGLTSICEKKRTLVILDEIHWARESVVNNKRQVFGSALEDAFKPAAQILSLSGTPWRSDRFPIPFVSYNNKGMVNSDAHCSYSRAVRENWCRAVVFKRENATLEFEADNYGTVLGDLAENTAALRRSDGEYSLEQPIGKAFLKTATDPDVRFGICMIEKAHAKLMQVRKRHPRAAGLVVAKDTECANRYAEQMKDTIGVEPIIVHSKNGSNHDDVDAFANGDSPRVISVDMITEGTDIPRLRVLVHLHTSMTVMFFRQLIGRIVRWEDGLEGDQTAYAFIPQYGPLHLMALDLEEEIPFAVDYDADDQESTDCPDCGEPRPCECPKPPPPPPPYYRALSSDDERSSGSTAEGEDFTAEEEAMADTISSDPAAEKYDATRVRQFVKMFGDPEFMDAQLRSMSLAEREKFFSAMRGGH